MDLGGQKAEMLLREVGLSWDMLKRAFLIVLAVTTTLPMTGCVAGEVVAAPVLVPLMFAGHLYSVRVRRVNSFGRWRLV